MFFNDSNNEITICLYSLRLPKNNSLKSRILDLSKKVEDDSRKTLVLDQLPISEENEDMKNMDSSSTPQTLSKATVIANPYGMVAAEKKKRCICCGIQ